HRRPAGRVGGRQRDGAWRGRARLAPATAGQTIHAVATPIGTSERTAGGVLPTATMAPRNVSIRPAETSVTAHPPIRSAETTATLHPPAGSAATSHPPVLPETLTTALGPIRSRFSAATVVRRTPPTYPRAALDAGIQGRVWIHALV